MELSYRSDDGMVILVEGRCGMSLRWWKRGDERYAKGKDGEVEVVRATTLRNDPNTPL